MHTVVRFILMSGLVLVISGCGISEQKATTKAKGYRIDENAPIKSDDSIIIAASPHRIWHFVTDIDHWAAWRPEVSAGHLNGRITAGTAFTWNVEDTNISSRIAAVEHQKRVAWTGRAMGLTAIHIWTIRSLAPNRTLVRTRESMTGFPSSLFYSSSDLRATNSKWLADLKHISEQAGEDR